MDYKREIAIKPKRGRPPWKKKPSKEDLEKLYVKEGKSIREVAETLDYPKEIVLRCLQRYGIKRRPPGRRKRLKENDYDSILEMIALKGLRKTAEDLGVSRQTLWRYIRDKTTKK